MKESRTNMPETTTSPHDVAPQDVKGTAPVDAAPASAMEELNFYNTSTAENTRSEATTSVTTPRRIDQARSSKSRINPDDPVFVRVITVGVGFAGLVAFGVSFVTLMEVGAWLGLPRWMHWAVPAFIDTAILVYAGSVLIHKTRGERTWPSWLLLGTFTALSVIANAAHALAYGQAQTAWQGIIGAVIAGMVPMAVFAATEQLSRVAVEDPISRRHELEAQATWLAEQAERERRQLEVEAERERARQETEIAREQHVTQLEIVRAQREALATQAAQAAERGEVFALPQSPKLASVPAPSTEEPATEPSPEPKPAAPKPRSSDLNEVVEFISTRTEQDLDTSGADLANEFGFSDKTGRRRLSALRKSHPHIFTGDNDG